MRVNWGLAETLLSSQEGICISESLQGFQNVYAVSAHKQGLKLVASLVWSGVDNHCNQKFVASKNTNLFIYYLFMYLFIRGLCYGATQDFWLRGVEWQDWWVTTEGVVA